MATNSFFFSESENKALINALNFKFDFNSWIINDHGLPSIFIPKKDLHKLQSLVLPYMLNDLTYKINF